jgi:coenzyme F420-dependent glucose-6-phosphate dehydrogenase
LARSNKIAIGTGVTAPILRYHPAIVAQVFATLGYMFPNRVFLGIGRGEALNEVTSGQVWPSNREKYERMKEAIKLIKKLWSEEWVNFIGDYYRVKDSKLYTKPKTPIPLFVAGLGKQSAMLAGEYGDGFVTNELNVDSISNTLFPALKKGAEKAGKDYNSLEKILFIPASYDPDDKQKATESIRFWRGAFFDVDVHDPRIIEENGQVIGNDTLENILLVVSNGQDAIEKLQKYAELGFTEIVLTNSSPNRDKLVKLIAEKIAPHFKNYKNKT